MENEWTTEEIDKISSGIEKMDISDVQKVRLIMEELPPSTIKEIAEYGKMPLSAVVRAIRTLQDGGEIEARYTFVG